MFFFYNGIVECDPENIRYGGFQKITHKNMYMWRVKLFQS